MITKSTEGQIGHVVPTITAAAIVAQQVGSNASRDALFLSHFAVTTLPYFVAAAALLSIPAARWSGRLLLRFGPQRVVPFAFGLGGALFLTDWWLLQSHPRGAATLLFFQSSILGSLAISAYWSLLNERFDPHAAKGLMGKVAAGATFGGLIGGLGAERVAALLSAGTLLILLGCLGFASVGGALMVATGAKRRSGPKELPSIEGGLSEIRRSALLSSLALVTVLAAIVGTLSDYVLKAAAAAHFTRPEELLRFFGAFYAATGVAAFVLQMTAGRVLLARLGLAGSVSVHPVAVAAGGLFAFVAPAPWLGVFPRGFDLTVRNSTYRAGYELLYAPLPESTKRRSKPFIDVGCDAFGKGMGALVVLPLSAIGGAAAILLVNAAAVLVAAAEFVMARRMQPAHVSALQEGLRRQAPDVEHPVQFALADFTLAQSMVGIDRRTIRTAMQQQPSAPAIDDQAGAGSPRVVPILVTVGVLRSGDRPRVREALGDLPHDPLIVAALIPLLERSDLVEPVVDALTAQTARAVGQVSDALLADDTPEVVRRRLPMVLMSWNSTRAVHGLMAGLQDPSPDVRFRCSQALLSLTASHPALVIPTSDVLAATEATLDRDDSAAQLKGQVFNLLGLVLDRQAVSIARHAFDGTDEYLRGTAFEYLESVLPPSLATRLIGRLGRGGAPPAPPRAAAAVRADLLRAGETITVSRDELRQRLRETGLGPAAADDAIGEMR